MGGWEKENQTIEQLVDTILADISGAADRSDVDMSDVDISDVDFNRRQVADFVKHALASAPIYIRVPIKILNVAFFVFAFFMKFGGRFSHHTAENKVDILNRWERISGVTDDHIRLLRTLALIPYSEIYADPAPGADRARQTQ